MQPDNIRPVARSPSFNLSDDISNSNRNTFPNRDRRSPAQDCAPNATIPLNGLSLKTAIIPAVRGLSRDAARYLWHICRKFSGLRLVSEQAGPGRRVLAISSPPDRHKYG